MAHHSGKFVIRLSPELHQRLKQQASQAGVSLNSQCVSLIEYALEYKKKQMPDQRLYALVKKLKSRFGQGLLGVLIFGSVVSQENFVSSDIDVLIVLEKRVLINRTLYRDWDESLDDSQKPIINPHFVHLPTLDQNCGSLWLEVMSKHEILWQKGRRLLKTLESIHEFILKEQVKFHELHGQPYWSWEKYA